MQQNQFLYVLKKMELKLNRKLCIGKKVTPSVDRCKYLGIIISVKSSDADSKRQTRKYYANANIQLRKCSYCSRDVKCCMLNVIVP